MRDSYDVGVIGGGPGGYAAAIRAAQLGGKVVLVEKDRLGGTCTNVGCIPTKASLRSVELFSEIKEAREFGVSVEDPIITVEALIQRNRKIVERIVGGIEHIVKSNGIDFLKGFGSLDGAKQIAVSGSDSVKRIGCKSAIIATGSRPAIPRIPGAEGKNVLTSDDAITLEKVPEAILIVGGGAVGVEFASIFARLGRRVSLIEMLPHLLPTEDEELAVRLQQSMRREGVNVMTGATVKKIDDSEGAKVITAMTPSEEVRIEGGVVLMAVGRRPNIEGLGLDDLGVVYDQRGIKVKGSMETSVPGVYAIGDVTGGLFAHVAYAEGFVAAENAMGLSSAMEYDAVPRCIYTIPEVASVGLTERQARERELDISVGRFPFTASGRALTLGDTAGLVKLICEKKSRRLLGVHIIGSRASDLISEAVLAVRLRATIDDLANAIHPHPTLSEAIREAALDAAGCPVHVIRHLSSKDS